MFSLYTPSALSFPSILTGIVMSGEKWYQVFRLGWAKTIMKKKLELESFLGKCWGQGHIWRKSEVRATLGKSLDQVSSFGDRLGSGGSYEDKVYMTGACWDLF